MKDMIVKAIKSFFAPLMFKKQLDENKTMFDQLRNKGCLDCGSHDFLEGPTASIAMNIKCANCGSKYNIAPMINWAERI